MIDMPMADKDITLLSFWKRREFSSILVKQQPHLCHFHEKSTVPKIRNFHLLLPLFTIIFCSFVARIPYVGLYSDLNFLNTFFLTNPKQASCMRIVRIHDAG